ncbi:Crp/Fnr family transcriptional regulator [Candidatus Sumerlaeota bacterium]|nr:Crp/Fnr family transcriptional regulator [Candidatus Sumerlaeota bacterium]
MTDHVDDTPKATEASAELIACLRESRVFAGFDADALSRIAALAEIMTLERGHILVTEGSATTQFFIVMHGQVSIQVESINPPMEVGIAKLGPGEIVGEGSLLAATARSATATLLQEGTVAKFEPELVMRALDENPGQAALFFRNIATVLAARQRLTDRRLLNLTRAQYFPQ